MAKTTELAEKRPYREMQEKLFLAAQVRDENIDGEEIQRRTVDSILTAETEDDLFAAASVSNGPESAEDLAGIPLTITGVSWHRSSDAYSDGGLGVFVVIECVTDRGVNKVVSSGAANVVTFMHAAEDRGMIDGGGLRIAFEVKETAKGNRIIGITRPAA